MTAAERLKKALIAHAEAETPVAKENAKKTAMEALGEVVEERDAQRRADRMEAMIQESFARSGIEYQKPAFLPDPANVPEIAGRLPIWGWTSPEEQAAIDEIADSFERLSYSINRGDPTMTTELTQPGWEEEMYRRFDEEQVYISRRARENHCLAVMKEIVDELEKFGITRATATILVNNMALGMMPHIRIDF